MRQKLAFVSMKMGNPSSTKGAAGDLGKPPNQGSRRSEAKPTIIFKGVVGEADNHLFYSSDLVQIILLN
jgi:hypothetical protein